MFRSRDVLGRGFGAPDLLLGLSMALGGSGMFGVGRPMPYARERQPHRLGPGECKLRETGSKRSRRRERARKKAKGHG